MYDYDDTCSGDHGNCRAHRTGRTPAFGNRTSSNAANDLYLAVKGLDDITSGIGFAFGETSTDLIGISAGVFLFQR